MTNPFAQPAPQQPQSAPPAAPHQGGNPFGPPAQAQPMQQQSFAPPAAPAPQAYAAPQQAAAPPSATIGGFRKPEAPTVGGGQGADLVAMYGRLVLMFPLSLATVARNPKFITEDQRARGDVMQPRMTATIVVLDGSNPIPFGGNPYAMPPEAHTKSEPLPHVSKALWISQSKLIEQCQPALTVAGQTGAGSDGAMTLGRLLRGGTEANSPWILGDATEADEAIAMYYLEGVRSGQFPHPLH